MTMELAINILMCLGSALLVVCSIIFPWRAYYLEKNNRPSWTQQDPVLRWTMRVAILDCLILMICGLLRLLGVVA